MTATIHAELDRKELLPAEHIVDTGYVDAKLLVESRRDYQIDLVGPTRKNYRWQARKPTGYDADHFLIDWEKLQATCPKGHKSLSWTPAVDNRKNEVIKIKFSTADCQVCPARSRCTQSSRHTRRTVTIRPHEQYLALKQRREQEETKEFKQVYAKRAGIEGTISESASGSWVYVVPAISGRRRPICNTSPLLPLSIWFAVWHGSMGFHALRLDVLLLFASMMRLKWVRQRYQLR
jgi:transposase